MIRGLRLIVLLGFVSLFGDISYEGAWSIVGPYLALLGAGPAVISAVSGAGELTGQVLRLWSGRWADRTGGYWWFAFAGYALNVLAIPLLAVVSDWRWAAAVLMLERAAKAIRTPARDVLLAGASEATGHGAGFGLHRALDQIGSVIGPLIAAAILAAKGDYRLCFLVLAVPALVAPLLLLGARGTRGVSERAGGSAAGFWPLVLGAGLMAAGCADFPVLAYHFKHTGLFQDSAIPLVYALAMASDAVSALVSGRLFDTLGRVVLPFAALLAGVAPLLLISQAAGAVLLGVVFWAAAVGVLEATMRAAIVEQAPAAAAGGALGMFHLVYGIMWFLGSLVIGQAYTVSPAAMAGICTGLEVCAVAVLTYYVRMSRSTRPSSVGPISR
ncbi:MAG: MFS transporter [Acidobacteria bacterium]|nr:MFS transporter [Acidobacteriota bacterium]